MDPIATWGAIIAVISAAGAGGQLASWRTIGRVEGLTERFAERLDRHSGAIDEHRRLLATLPSKVESVEGSVRALHDRLEEISETATREHATLRGEMSESLERVAAAVGAELCEQCPTAREARNG